MFTQINLDPKEQVLYQVGGFGEAVGHQLSVGLGLLGLRVGRLEQAKNCISECADVRVIEQKSVSEIILTDRVGTLVGLGLGLGVLGRRVGRLVQAEH